MLDPKKKKIILKTAQQLFGAKGYANTTMRDIAQKSKIAQGTTYLYFKNKEALFSELMTYLIGEVNQLMEAALHEQVDLMAKLRIILDHVLTFAIANKDLLSMFLREVVLFESLKKKKKVSFVDCVDAIDNKILEAFMSTWGGGRRAQAKEAADFFLIALGGTIRSAMQDLRLRKTVNKDEKINLVMRFLEHAYQL